MSGKMSGRASRRVGRGPKAAWASAILTCFCATSACLSEVYIPACVRDDTCSPGGQSSGGDETGGAGMTPPGGGGRQTTAGNGGEGGTGEGGVADGGSSGALAAGGSGGEMAPCPGCRINPHQLLAPCSGKKYRAKLSATGGTPPYAWELAPALPEWSIALSPGDPSIALLEGEWARGQTEVGVRAIDALGKEISRTYRIEARDTCWFAYTASGSEGSRLALLDGLAEDSEPEQLEHNQNVFDFAFSPDGHFLVYRYGADEVYPRGRHLSLVDLVTLEETSLTFAEDAVTAYAWSPDASVLSVGFSANGETFVGGVRVSRSAGLRALTPVPAFVEQSLTWVGTAGVAFDAELLPDLDNPGEFLPDNDDHLRTPFFAKLLTTSFDEPLYSFDSFEPGSVIEPGYDGFWVVDPVVTMFFPIGGEDLTAPAAHSRPLLLSPSRKHSARFQDQVFSIFAAERGARAIATTEPTRDCQMPLAWSSGDLIACVVDVENGSGNGKHGEVRLFGLTGSSQLSMATLGGFCEDDTSWSGQGSCTGNGEGYGYGVEPATNAPREFSGAGRWFAFSRAGYEQGGASNTSAYVYVADVGADAPNPTKHLLFPDLGRPARLAFSPDETMLAMQIGTRLSVEPLLGVGEEILLTKRLDAVGTCTEEFTKAPSRYCGNTSQDTSFKWSPDSVAVAYRSATSLHVADVAHNSGTSTAPWPVCTPPACSGDFEFQPIPRL